MGTNRHGCLTQRKGMMGRRGGREGPSGGKVTGSQGGRSTGGTEEGGMGWGYVGKGRDEQGGCSHQKEQHISDTEQQQRHTASKNKPKCVIIGLFKAENALHSNTLL